MTMQLGEAFPILQEVWSSGLPVREAAAKVLSPEQLAPGGAGAQLLAILTGPHAERYVNTAFALWLFSNLGVILLLFVVGLESTVKEMLAVGARALAVAVVGVVAPFGLGFGVTRLLLPDAPSTVALFVGATLCATSVGITARVFKDLGRMQTREAKIILGAAVIDDILGLVVLAVVVGIVASGEVRFGPVARIGVLSAIFLAVVVAFGERIVRALIPLMRALDRTHLKLLFPLALAFSMAWLATQIELAAIVGAFAAGLVLNEELFPKDTSIHHTVHEMVQPVEAIFAPVFFVLMGMQVNLATFLSPQTVAVALALTVAGVVGKLVAGWPAGRGTDAMTVGIGMIPRGEVGLIFASVGKGIGVVDDALFSAVVIMVVITTLLAPILLKWSLDRARR
jgi:Kef-type K+ transport system membrane component KefB